MSGSTISMIENEPGTETVCLEFTNGQDTKTLDVVVHYNLPCTPGITMSNFAHNQTTAAYSDLQGKFTFEGFTEGCGNTITYQIAAPGKKTPNGLTGQILNEECGDKNCISIISETQLSADIEFSLHVTADGVE